MVKVIIDNQEVEVAEGTTLINAAAMAGIKIPAMCHNGQLDHFTSCMICLVKDKFTGKMVPSCSAVAIDGLQVITFDDEIFQARQMALELLLSEHVGECEAPCRIACPAFMNIPLMNRLIAKGLVDEALEVVLKDIALPGVLGRICPAPCENACRRKPVDQPVAVCLLKRFAAGVAKPNSRTVIPSTGKRVAVIGAGAAGLAAAYYLQLNGVQVVIFDKNNAAGGNMRYEIDSLDKSVLDSDIDRVKQSGVIIKQDHLIEPDSFNILREEYDALLVATGNFSPGQGNWGLDNNGKQLSVNKDTYQTNIPGVFAAGNIIRPGKLAIRSAAQGKEAAVSIIQLLRQQHISGYKLPFNSVFGKLNRAEHDEYLKEATLISRQQVTGSEGFDNVQAMMEAGRCMHCDCRKASGCLLRDYAGEYQVSKNRFKYTERKLITKDMQHEQVVHEPGKCIRCGICVRITAKHREKHGLTFIGRGFNVEVKPPFGQNLRSALTITANMVCEACPTGALAKL